MKTLLMKLFVLALCVTGISFAQNASIKPVTDAGPFPPGVAFLVKVEVGDPVQVAGLYGLSLKLHSDQGWCQYVDGSAAADTFLGAGLLTFFQKVDSQTVDMAVTRTSPPSKSGSGIVAKAQFIGSSTGSVGFSLLDVAANDSAGNPIPLDASTLTVTIGTPPKAGFGGVPRSGIVPLDVTFTDSSVAGSNPITSWSWDFNHDGIEDANGQGPHAFQYSSPGSYDVRLIVSDGSMSDTVLKVSYITVLPPETADVRPNSPDTSVHPGTPFWIEARVGDSVAVTGLYGISMKLGSDEHWCQYVEGSAVAGSFLGGGLLTFFQKVDSQTVDMAVSRTSPPGQSGNGILAQAQFIAYDTGWVNFSLKDVVGNDQSGGGIPLKSRVRSLRIAPFTITASAGGHGSITPSGVFSLSYGDSLRFSFHPDACYRVDSVFVDGHSVADSLEGYTFRNLTGNHTLSVTFALIEYTITATAGEHGTITPPGTVHVNCGDSVTFTFHPDGCYRVDSVIVDGSYAGSDTALTLRNVQENHTLRVAFTALRYFITASAGDHGSVTPSGQVAVQCDSSIAFTFHADAGYRVDSVFVDGAFDTAKTAYTFHNVHADHTLWLTFRTGIYTITSTADTGGTITPLGTVSVNYGDSARFELAPQSGYHIADVIVDDTSRGNPSSYTFHAVASNHTIHGHFAVDTLTILASAGSHGTVTPSGTVKVVFGNDRRFTFLPDADYRVDSVLVDGTDSPDSIHGYSFYNVRADHELHVTFIKRDTIHVFIDSLRMFRLDTIRVPVNIRLPDGRTCSAAELDFNGFAPELRFIGIDTAKSLAGTAKWHYQVNNLDTLLLTASAGADAISGSGVLFSMVFVAVGEPCQDVPIRIARAKFNAGEDIALTKDGVVHVMPKPSYGDVNGNDSVEAMDAALVLRHAIGMDTLRCQAFANADVDTSGSVTSFDAALILMDVVKLIDHLPFDTTLADSGDLRLIDVTTGAKDTASVVLSLISSKEIHSFDGVITYDPGSLRFLDIAWGPLFSQGHIISQTDSASGVVRFSGGCPAEVGPSGNFATLRFMTGSLKGTSTVTLKHLRWNKGRLRDDISVGHVVVGVRERPSGIPVQFSLGQNYPNPFNPATTIEYQLPSESRVSIRIYNTLGEQVAVLADGTEQAGYKSVRWNGNNLPSGVYFYRLVAISVSDPGQTFTGVKKLILMK